MLKKLGITKLAYDWRAEHVPTFDAECDAMKKHDIELHVDKVKVQAGRLLFDRDPAEGIPEGVAELGREIAERLPKVELTDLLVEVDRLTGFSRYFTHAGGAEPRTAELRVHLYASILAQATNIGPVSKPAHDVRDTPAHPRRRQTVVGSVAGRRLVAEARPAGGDNPQDDAP